jgi:hypothetical protein
VKRLSLLTFFGAAKKVSAPGTGVNENISHIKLALAHAAGTPKRQHPTPVNENKK